MSGLGLGLARPATKLRFTETFSAVVDVQLGNGTVTGISQATAASVTVNGVVQEI